jgi:phenol 2-monooxygenase
MQFHLNGFTSGDPFQADDDRSDPRGSRAFPDEVDVLIVGCGPAGLTLAAQLAAFPGITTRIIEQKAGPLRVGQADGLACRTMEMFESFDFSDRVLKEAYWVNEIVFWKPDDADRRRIVRHARAQDTEDGLSEFPHVILNQARVHDFLLDVMRRLPARLEPDYSCRFLDASRLPAATGCGPREKDGDVPPLTIRIQRLEPFLNGRIDTIRARFLVGCDGAKSTVRNTIGLRLQGDSANRLWGVMDLLAVTDFPDVRLKAVVQSASHGNLLLIPREGGYLVRVYVELDSLQENERASAKDVRADDVIAAAQRILHPYTFDVKEVAWWSVYEIGQRLCDTFDDASGSETLVPRVFLLGDSCHTHSPKAGQGMNVAMGDAFNLGWKLAAVIEGRATPALLGTYTAERRGLARELLDFDRQLADMFNASVKDPGDPTSSGIDPITLQRFLLKQGRFTAGTAVRYGPSIITGPLTYQRLAEGLPIGMRFHSARVIRLADGKPIHLGHVVKADGRWRLFAFAAAGDCADAPSSRLGGLCRFLAEALSSPVRRYTPKDGDIDAAIDVRAVFQQSWRELSIAGMPALLWPAKGRYGLRDYEKVFCVESHDNVFDRRGINRAAGCVVLVRPDQYVASVLPLDAHDELAAFFDAVLTE